MLKVVETVYRVEPLQTISSSTMTIVFDRKCINVMTELYLFGKLLSYVFPIVAHYFVIKENHTTISKINWENKKEGEVAATSFFYANAKNEISHLHVIGEGLGG